MELKSKKNSPEVSVEIVKLQAEKDELLADLQRTRADFENFRKQVELQREQAKKLATDATVMKFLPLIDDMSRAISSNPEALAPILKTLEKTMNELGLSKIQAENGVEFNPDFHDAISMEEGDGEKEVIAEELRPGYLYNGEVLRPAMVRVKKA
ncbi:MAG: nucleotide exchange factor GrpE [Candidatus Saccharibacteria bacterium]|nr:nucleotide exchange factor GrpE [Candidatus Saccharibacteria bacterium]